jgi:hypothetical protein
MINKIKGYALATVAVLTFLAPGLVPLAANAASTCTGTSTGLESGINYAISNSSTNGTGSLCDANGVDNSSIGHIANTIVTIFSIIVGGASIIMIIYGGFRYITSGGDSTKVGNAKSTLIYAIIGLVIVALAQVIVHFVLNQSGNIASSSNT